MLKNEDNANEDETVDGEIIWDDKFDVVNCGEKRERPENFSFLGSVVDCDDDD